MNKKFKVLIIAILLPLGVLVPALSMHSYYLPVSSAQNQETGSLKSRKERYKKIVESEEFSTTEEDRIRIRCLAVQTNIKALNQRLNAVQKRRAKVYDSIISRLSTVAEGASEQGVGVKSLNQEIDAFSGKVSTYKSTMSDYTQAVADMTNIDCREDPVSFRGALEEARIKHAELITQVIDIREYVENTLKPVLQQVRDALAASNANSSGDENATE